MLVGTIALVILLAIGKKAGWFGQDFSVKVSVEQPENRTIIEIITANGKIQPETEVKISADVSGEIVELYVEEGQQVIQGQLLVKIKPETYMSALDRANAALNSSRSNLANSKARLAQVKAQFNQAQLSYDRNKSLFNQGAISKAEFENAESAYLVAKAEVEASEQTVNATIYAVNSAEASLKEANENLQKTTIYAPMSGTISKLNVEKGERVVGTMQMAGTEIMRIANLSKMEVLVEVNENDIVRVNRFDTALIQVDAYLDQKFKGLVTEIANSANVVGGGTDQVTNFQIKIAMIPESYANLIPKDKPGYYPFRPGMSATVDIQTETAYNVISIPIQSVTTRKDSSGVAEIKTEMVENDEDDEVKINDDSKKLEEQQVEKEPIEVVFVINDKTVKMVPVTTGLQDNNYIQIISGLTVNDKVVSAPYSAISKQLKNNQTVTVVKKEELFKDSK